jgi:hypothetical protein
MQAISTEHGLETFLQRTKEYGVIALPIQPTLLCLGSKHDSRPIEKFMYWNSARRLSVLKITLTLFCQNKEFGILRFTYVKKVLNKASKCYFQHII